MTTFERLLVHVKNTLSANVAANNPGLSPDELDATEQRQVSRGVTGASHQQLTLAPNLLMQEDGQPPFVYRSKHLLVTRSKNTLTIVVG